MVFYNHVYKFSSSTDETDSTSGILRFQSLYSDTSNYGLISDSGASILVSPFVTDFVLWEPSSQDPSLHGLLETQDVHGVGQAKFKVTTDDGSTCTIVTQAFYVFTAKVHLLSTSDTLPTKAMEGSSLLLLWLPFIVFLLIMGGCITFPPDKTNNNPIGATTWNSKFYK